MPLTVYQFPACSTCRKALKWLDEQGIAHERLHIVEQPPSREVLTRALAQGLPLRALFNTSGLSYREGKFKERLPTLSADDALDELAKDGKLIKRPFVVGEDLTLAGFHPADWEKALT